MRRYRVTFRSAAVSWHERESILISAEKYKDHYGTLRFYVGGREVATVLPGEWKYVTEENE